MGLVNHYQAPTEMPPKNTGALLFRHVLGKCLWNGGHEFLNHTMELYVAEEEVARVNGLIDAANQSPAITLELCPRALQICIPSTPLRHIGGEIVIRDFESLVVENSSAKSGLNVSRGDNDDLPAGVGTQIVLRDGDCGTRLTDPHSVIEERRLIGALGRQEAANEALHRGQLKLLVRITGIHAVRLLLGNRVLFILCKLLFAHQLLCKSRVLRVRVETGLALPFIHCVHDARVQIHALYLLHQFVPFFHGIAVPV